NLCFDLVNLYTVQFMVEWNIYTDSLRNFDEKGDLMDWTVFEEKIHQRMKEEHIPGVAIAVSKDVHIVYEKGFGVRDFETKRPVTPRNNFWYSFCNKIVHGTGHYETSRRG